MGILHKTKRNHKGSTKASKQNQVKKSKHRTTIFQQKDILLVLHGIQWEMQWELAVTQIAQVPSQKDRVMMQHHKIINLPRSAKNKQGTSLKQTRLSSNQSTDEEDNESNTK